MRAIKVIIIIFSLWKTVDSGTITLTNDKTTMCVMKVDFQNKPAPKVVRSSFAITDKETWLFYAHAKDAIIIHLKNDSRTHLVKIPYTTEWRQFTISVESNATFVRGNDIPTEIDFAATCITVENADLILLKTFDCNALVILPCKTSCPEIDVSMNSTHFLTTTKNNNETLEINRGQNILAATSRKQCPFEVQVNQKTRETRVFFPSDSYVNLNYRNKMVIYKDTSLDRNLSKITCMDLDIKNNTQSNRSNGTSCQIGQVGPSCDISCESVLGSEYPYCQQHKICENKHCVCSWGNSGSFCNESCGSNTWGQSCLNNCAGCENCDTLTGKCSNGSRINTFHFVYLILTLVLLINARNATKL